MTLRCCGAEIGFSGKSICAIQEFDTIENIAFRAVEVFCLLFSLNRSDADHVADPIDEVARLVLYSCYDLVSVVEPHTVPPDSTLLEATGRVAHPCPAR
jgi:hypothetical protein